MKKSNGFTLIELLAVIVILAIIALIATPTIIGLIDNARKESFKNTTYGIIKAGEVLYSKDLLNGTTKEVTFTYTDGVESSSVAGKNLNYSGSKPDSGTVVVNDEGEVTLIIYNGTYCAIKGFDESEVILLDIPEAECAFADTSGASIPELATGMIPIKWDSTNNRWIKADVNNVIGANEWYDYSSKEWANVVLVTYASRNTYNDAAVGTVINEADVLAYFVWIPRYKYAIPAGAGARSINIVFESKTTDKSTGNAIDTNYRTHPTFTFGTTELNGIWVGKFETTGNISSMTIKPNLVSMSNQSVSGYFTAVRNMENSGNVYGLVTNNVDTHMMKNSDWGAVTYLSRSIYGKNSEVWINNSSTYVTGCAGSSVSAAEYNGCQNQYHTANGVNASTTGNVYGVYDMSGGANEFVMGNVNGYTGMLDNATSHWHSGFNGPLSNGGSITGGIPFPESKYYNLYPVNSLSTSITTACDGGICYGQALSETSGWNSDLLDTLVNINYPWLVRGDGYYDGSAAGIFALEGYCGHSQGMAIRITITLE